MFPLRRFHPRSFKASAIPCSSYALAERAPSTSASVALAKRVARKKPKGGALSPRAISASLAEQGHLNERGKPFNPKSVATMLAT
jgi:hypothetical protein